MLQFSITTDDQAMIATILAAIKGAPIAVIHDTKPTSEDPKDATPPAEAPKPAAKAAKAKPAKVEPKAEPVKADEPAGDDEIDYETLKNKIFEVSGNLGRSKALEMLSKYGANNASSVAEKDRAACYNDACKLLNQDADADLA